jgi:prolipoprotein diacylglyceryltransferase
MLYTLGRGGIEILRTDTANHILGMRLNVWTSVIVFLGALYGFWRAGRNVLQEDVQPESKDDAAAQASQ